MTIMMNRLRAVFSFPQQENNDRPPAAFGRLFYFRGRH
jgi:hypothetical protein